MKKKAEKRPEITANRGVVGYLTLPVEVMMLRDDKAGKMPMLISDCIAEIKNGEGETVGEVGGAMGASLHLRIGENTFKVGVRGLWNGFVDFLNQHPELAQGVKVADLSKISEAKK